MTAETFDQWFDRKWESTHHCFRQFARLVWNAAKAAEALKSSHNDIVVPCKSYIDGSCKKTRKCRGNGYTCYESAQH